MGTFPKTTQRMNEHNSPRFVSRHASAKARPPISKQLEPPASTAHNHQTMPSISSRILQCPKTPRRSWASGHQSSFVSGPCSPPPQPPPPLRSAVVSPQDFRPRAPRIGCVSCVRGRTHRHRHRCRCRRQYGTCLGYRCCLVRKQYTNHGDAWSGKAKRTRARLITKAGRVICTVQYLELDQLQKFASVTCMVQYLERKISHPG